MCEPTDGIHIGTASHCMEQPGGEETAFMGNTCTATILTEFRQPLQVQSHLEMPRILVQLGHIQRT